MENASKALIIAGAILLSILLISLGIMIFNQAQSAIDGSGMSDAQLTAFNQKWLKYEGKQKGSTVKILCQEVLANNTNDEASSETQVSVTGSATVSSDGATISLANIINTKTYNVSFTYNKGRISSINIQ